MANLKMVSPWVDYYAKTKAMFAEDKNVCVVLDEDTTTLKLYVKEQEKADAIERLLPAEKDFGGVTLKIEVYPGNRNIGCIADGFKSGFNPESEGYIARLFELAFHNNNALQYTRVVDGFAAFHATYIVFEKAVVQYYNDSLADLHGMRSTLYQDIAKEIFVEYPGVYYCTDDREKDYLPF